MLLLLFLLLLLLLPDQLDAAVTAMAMVIVEVSAF